MLDSITLREVLDAGSQLTAGGILLLVLIGFLKGWIVPGPVYRQALEDIEDLKKINEGLRTTFDKFLVESKIIERRESVVMALRKQSDVR